MLLLLIFINSFFPNACAQVIEYSKAKSYFQLIKKNEWVVKHDVFGMPFILYSPKINNQRSNLTITDTNIDLELNFKILEKSQEQYQLNKKKWAEKNHAEVIGFQKLTNWINKQGHQIYQIGVDYRYNSDHYVETSFYLNCFEKIIYSKSLRLAQNIAHEKDFKEMIETLTCKRGEK